MCKKKREKSLSQAVRLCWKDIKEGGRGSNERDNKALERKVRKVFLQSRREKNHAWGGEKVELVLFIRGEKSWFVSSGNTAPGAEGLKKRFWFPRWAPDPPLHERFGRAE